ncbi:MAG: tRNA (adenosine(37)-N6)-dimethylallyltransferase MiaA [Limisphaerales bacterium]
MSLPGPSRPEFHGPALHLAGPTASGKSAVAVELALRLGGEILSADSMQVYRGLDIGTAKPTAERTLVPHHLIDLAEPGEGFDVTRWLDAARAAVAAVRARGRVPIFCGGTGLYFRAWLEGFDPLPAPDPALRQVLEHTPLAELLEELKRDDPDTHDRIDRFNPRRVVRAVEILRLGGSGRRTRTRAGTPGGASASVAASAEPVFVLRRVAEDLRRRMETRVDAMFARGLVEETRSLLSRGLGDNRIALQAIGYRQVVEHLRGERDLADAIALVKSRTWQYGRRQMSWFRSKPGVVWVDVGVAETPAEVADRILQDPAVRGMNREAGTEGGLPR